MLDSTILIIIKFFFDNNILYVSGNIIKKHKSFFYELCDSKQLNIFIVDHTCTVAHAVIEVTYLHEMF